VPTLVLLTHQLVSFVEAPLISVSTAVTKVYHAAVAPFAGVNAIFFFDFLK
jgi:hypothetical protein